MSTAQTSVKDNYYKQAREGGRSPGAGVTGGHLIWCWELNAGPLQEQ